MNYGLFSLPNLHRPNDFLTLAHDAIQKCNSLREIIQSSVLSMGTDNDGSGTHSSLSPRETLHVLDNISNTVCSVIDASELCRSVHSSEQWRQSASVAFHMLSEYIAELNADASLYQSLVPITSNASVMSSLSEEERRMATLLQKEFERDSIHLPEDQRAQVQQLNAVVVQLETIFMENLTEHKRFNVYGNAAQDVYRTIPKDFLDQNIPTDNHGSSAPFVTLSTEPHIVNSLLKYSPSAALRKEVYMETNTQCPQNLEVLDALIQQRHALAVQMGYPSYAHYFLSDKMASSPVHVNTFLGHVMKASKDRYNRDLDILSKAKTQVEGTYEPLQPWDLSFYMGLVKNHLCQGQDDAGEGSLAGYFTVDGTLEGMKILVKRLFGIEMVEVELKRDERWDATEMQSSVSRSGIRKFEFFQEIDEKPLGTMYLDLYPRPGKYTHAAHFTVRCGCVSRLKTSNIDDGIDSQQLPIVALVFNLSPPSVHGDAASILSHSEVETMFHEFGHAMHSLLSRTSFQHLSGTRSAMDFVETPSHLMEYYVWNNEFLNIIGRHYQTGNRVPERNVENLIKSRTLFKALEVQSQCVYSIFDQTIFGIPEKWKSVGSTTDLFAKLSRENGLLYADGTHWHSKFGHLVSYGAGYYSYLYASIFAADIWKKCFDNGADAFNRKVGQKYWNEILIHGGSKDPHQMLKSMLGRQPEVDSFFQLMTL